MYTSTVHRLALLLIVCFSFSGLSYAQKEKAKLTAPIAPEPIQRTPYSDVRRESLLNGLQIITLERQNEEKVTLELVNRSGAMFDLAGKTGLAQLTTATLLAVNPELLTELESLQAKFEWGINHDSIWFRVIAPPDNLQEVISRLARLLVIDAIRPEAFQAAQQATLDTIKRTQPKPEEIATNAFENTIYGEYPYGHNVIGSVDSVTAIKQGDVYDFYKRIFLANNMFAIVHGNIKHPAVMKLFRMYFGGWLKGVVPPTAFRPPVRLTEPRIQKIEQANLTEVEIRGGLVGVSHTDPDFLPTLILAKVLDKRLQKIYPQASAQFTARTLPAPLSFTARIPAELAQEFSRKATETFATLTQEISELELAQAQAELLQVHAARDIPDHLREIALFKLPENYPLMYDARIKSVGTSDLQRVAKRLIEANALTVLVLGKMNDSGKTSE